MNNEMQSIELDINQARRMVEKQDTLRALQKNRHFKKLIMEDYFEKEAVRLVLLRGDPTQMTKEDFELITKQMDAIAFLRQYFVTINHFGTAARNSLKQDEATREEILAEELENDEAA